MVKWCHLPVFAGSFLPKVGFMATHYILALTDVGTSRDWTHMQIHAQLSFMHMCIFTHTNTLAHTHVQASQSSARQMLTQKSANSLAHFSVEEMRRGSSSQSSKLQVSPPPLVFGTNGASTCKYIYKTKHYAQQQIIRKQNIADILYSQFYIYITSSSNTSAHCLCRIKKNSFFFLMNNHK